MLQVVLKALLQDRKAAETPKKAKAAKFSFSVRAWARLKAFILLILLLYTIPGMTYNGCLWLNCDIVKCMKNEGAGYDCLIVFILLVASDRVGCTEISS